MKSCDILTGVGLIEMSEIDRDDYNLTGFWYTSNIPWDDDIYVIVYNKNDNTLNDKYTGISLQKLRDDGKIRKFKIKRSKLRDVKDGTIYEMGNLSHDKEKQIRKYIFETIMSKKCVDMSQCPNLKDLIFEQ